MERVTANFPFCLEAVDNGNDGTDSGLDCVKFVGEEINNHLKTNTYNN